ncbi:carbon catabolite repressor protein 4 homolog 3-like [Dioscorea cayenensis subsp. rotundata]|uniref:Carbon catabolite repressor protein 4 homolog 3-like n=1 Tax=Dioscorea cayennensis subsp. rotundata TaxID=55577 RepID=A0AB40D052_DIOCR|nr:carbon catabolite repressor protein 4 homolog 3-like [Dioscorea cayenensis subsp. rotundata]
MACDSSLFGCNRALLVTASAPRLSKRRASSGQALAGLCSRPSLPRDCRWYNPLGMRKKWFRPSEPIRHWVEAEGCASLLDSNGVGIMVVSYNILGDHNAWNHRDLYCKVSFDLLKWESRKSLICNEICKWNADLVCLQEVDRFYDILSVMKREGYAGKYKRRTGGTRDGCAVLWKEERFQLMEAENIEFADFGLRDNVAQLFVFEMCEADSRRIVIGNIHVLFNPKRGDVKLGQVRMLLEKAYDLSEKWGNIPILVMGDFNCHLDVTC